MNLKKNVMESTEKKRSQICLIIATKYLHQEIMDRRSETLTTNIWNMTDNHYVFQVTYKQKILLFTRTEEALRINIWTITITISEVQAIYY